MTSNKTLALKWGVSNKKIKVVQEQIKSLTREISFLYSHIQSCFEVDGYHPLELIEEQQEQLQLYIYLTKKQLHLQELALKTGTA